MHTSVAIIRASVLSQRIHLRQTPTDVILASSGINKEHQKPLTIIQADNP